jgi:hypothetical protein
MDFFEVGFNKLKEAGWSIKFSTTSDGAIKGTATKNGESYFSIGINADDVCSDLWFKVKEIK